MKNNLSFFSKKKITVKISVSSFTGDECINSLCPKTQLTRATNDLANHADTLTKDSTVKGKKQQHGDCLTNITLP